MANAEMKGGVGDELNVIVAIDIVERQVEIKRPIVFEVKSIVGRKIQSVGERQMCPVILPHTCHDATVEEVCCFRFGIGCAGSQCKDSTD